jgi:hypothetical protein
MTTCEYRHLTHSPSPPPPLLSVCLFLTRARNQLEACTHLFPSRVLAASSVAWLHARPCKTTAGARHIVMLTSIVTGTITVTVTVTVTATVTVTVTLVVTHIHCALRGGNTALCNNYQPSK